MHHTCIIAVVKHGSVKELVNYSVTFVGIVLNPKGIRDLNGLEEFELEGFGLGLDGFGLELEWLRLTATYPWA